MIPFTNTQPLQTKQDWMAPMNRPNQSLYGQYGLDTNQGVFNQQENSDITQDSMFVRGYNEKYMNKSNAFFTGLGILGQRNKNSYQNAQNRFNQENNDYQNLNQDLYSTRQDYYGNYQKGGSLKDLYETMSLDPESYQDELQYFKGDYDNILKQEEMSQYKSIDDYIDKKFNDLPQNNTKEVVNYQFNDPYENYKNPYIGNEIQTNPYNQNTQYQSTYAPPLNIGFNVRPMALPKNTSQFSIISQKALANNVPPEILAGVYGAETSYGANVRTSSAGAQGPFQFMPATAMQYGINPHNFEQAADAAAKYLSSSYKKTGNWEDVIASYNAGLGNVKRWKKIPETSNYVAKVLANAKSLKGKL